MLTRVVHEQFAYTGVELRPHFLLSQYGLEGTGAIAWMGPCQVKNDHLVDWKDRLEGEWIAAESMVHVLAEFFFLGLREGVFLQRLFVGRVAEVLRSKTRLPIRWRGNDLFAETQTGELKKLSVSIVTASPVSTLLHFGINVDPSGSPVPALGLLELGWNLNEIKNEFIPKLLATLQEELSGCNIACTKVRPVL